MSSPFLPASAEAVEAKLQATRTSVSTVWFLSGQIRTGEPLRHVPIHGWPFVIGRRPDVTLSLPCQTVSGRHAEIREREGGIAVCDLGSTNGTYVNGQRIAGETPLQHDDLIQFADVPFRVRLQDSGVSGRTLQEDVCDRALALVQFDNLMNQRAVVPYFQPIVDFKSRQVTGYEVLGRSRLVGLETPSAMFRAAGQLNLEVELSRMLRWEGIQAASPFGPDPELFVNTHPAEMAASGLIESIHANREIDPQKSLTLEIHEAAVTDAAMMRELRAVLTDLDMKLAYDDFGAGQTRLIELVEVRPDYLKFDMSLIRGIHTATASRQQMLGTLVRMVRELDIIPLAEGIECEGEHDTCLQLDFELSQGFLYGKPAPIRLCSPVLEEDHPAMSALPM